MPGEEVGLPFFRRVSSLLPRTPTSHLPKTFDWWGGGAQGVRSGLVLKEFLCAVQKRDIPVTSILPSSVCFGGSRGGSPLPARLAPCGVQRQRLCWSSRGGAPGGFILLLEIVP